jgi:hypothetical protein
MTSLVISHVAFTELATNYGPIDQFWFDHGNDLFVDLVDEFQPDALVLGRDFISDGAPALALGGTEQVRNTPFLSRSILKLIILPRQARDKHIGEVDFLKKKGRFSQGFVLQGPDSLWSPAYPTGTSNSSANSYLTYQCDTSLSSSGWFWHPVKKQRRHILAMPFSFQYTVSLPRQARDKHRENSKKESGVSLGRSADLQRVYGG